MKKRMVSLILVLCFVLTAFPTFGLAANEMEPVVVHDGDNVVLRNSWASVKVESDGIYRFSLPQSEDSSGVYAIYQIPEDTSKYSENEIAYIKQDLRIFVYDIMLQSARDSVQAGEQSLSEGVKAHEQAVKTHEAARRSYNLFVQYRDQIETLLSQYRQIESSGRAPFGYISVPDYYARNVRPRLISMGYQAPEDGSTAWKSYLDFVEEMKAFEQAEKELPLFEEQYQQACEALDNAKEELNAFEKEYQAAQADYEQSKAALKEPYPNTDDYLLLNWGYAGFEYENLHDDECYWLMKDGMGAELPATVSLLASFREDNEWPQKLPGMYYADGTYALVVRSDGEQRTYYNGLLMEATPDENGVVTIPETIQEAVITEIGANVFSGNNSITAVYIPASITRIQTDAFHDCAQLQDIYYDGTQSEWNAIHISDGNESLTAAALHVKDDSSPSASPEPTPTPTAEPTPTPSDSPEPTPSVNPEPTKAELPFQDVPKTAWFYSNVVSVWEKGIMKGRKSDLFAPLSTTTRAEFAAVIYRIANGTPMASDKHFSDVAPADWFYDAVTWAYDNKIVMGVGDSRFDPYSPVTREQMVTMLCRFASGVGTGSTLTSFRDADQISEYAKLPVSWAVEQGIVTGTNLGTINPQGNTTRAEMAAILDRYLSK